MKHIIFNFHGVGDIHSMVDKSEAKYWLSVDSYIQALNEIRQLKDTTDREVSITFDDGNMSDFTIAMPELLKRNLTATFFVCSGRIGKANYLDKSEIRDLLHNDMGIGSHGVDHINLRKVSKEDLEREVHLSRKVLEDICSTEIDSFAIPFGSYDRRVLKALKRAKYTKVFTSDGGEATSYSWMQVRQTLRFDWANGNQIQQAMMKVSKMKNLKRNLSKLYKSCR